MIVQMTKYDLVVFHRDKEAFLERLQELGLVDVTTTGWEPDEEEHRLLASIERHRAAVARLRDMATKEGFVPGAPYATGPEAWDAYTEAAAAVFGKLLSLFVDQNMNMGLPTMWSSGTKPQ